MKLSNKIMLITYADSMGRNLGELHEIINKHYKKAVGGIHILPFFPSSADRGFAPIRYDTVAAFGLDGSISVTADGDRISITGTCGSSELTLNADLTNYSFNIGLRENICRGKYKLAERPVLINNWEATYFDFNAEKNSADSRRRGGARS